MVATVNNRNNSPEAGWKKNMQRKPDKDKKQRRGGASGVAPPTAGSQACLCHSSPAVSGEVEADRKVQAPSGYMLSFNVFALFNILSEFRWSGRNLQDGATWTPEPVAVWGMQAFRARRRHMQTTRGNPEKSRREHTGNRK